MFENIVRPGRMQYHFPYDAFGPHIEHHRSPVSRRMEKLDLRSIQNVKDGEIEMGGDDKSFLNSNAELDHLQNLRMTQQTSGEHVFLKKYEGKKEQLHDSCQHLHQTKQDKQQHTCKHQQEEEMSQFRHKTHHCSADWKRPGKEFVILEETETSEGLQEVQKTTSESTVSFQNMSVRDLLQQCQNHFRAIDTCAILQQFISDEMMKQSKLDDIVCQKLTAQTKRLKQQTAFLEKSQGSNWARVSLNNLSTRVSEQARAHKMRSTSLTKQCQAIQRSIDDPDEIGKPIMAWHLDTRHCSTSEAEVRSDVTVKPLPISEKPSYLDGAQAQDMNPLHISQVFEEIRKPWIKLLCVLEYQQEQNDATATLIAEVKDQIQTISKVDKNESMLRRVQSQKRDLQIKKESLEARKDHLQKQLDFAKEDLSNFELHNRDSIIDILNKLRQHSDRYDVSLRQNFQTLKMTSLGDPVHMSDQFQSSGIENTIDEKSDKNTCLTGSSLPSRSLTTTPKKETELSREFNNARWAVARTSVECSKHTNNFHGANQGVNSFLTSMLEMNLKTTASEVKERMIQNKTNRNNASLQGLLNDQSFKANADLQSDSWKRSVDYNVSRAHNVLNKPEAIGDGAKEKLAALGNKDQSESEMGSVKEVERPCQRQMTPHECEIGDNVDMSILSEDERDNKPDSRMSKSFQYECALAENCVNISRQSAKRRLPDDKFDKYATCNLPYLCTGKSMRDILSRKPTRAAYFISKYAGGKHNGRAHLIKNVNGATSSVAYSVSKENGLYEKYLGTGCMKNKPHF